MDPAHYPHDTHPGLVPGIAVDENRHRFGLDPVVFGITAVLVVAFVAWGLLAPASVGAASSAAFGWAMTNAGWLLNAAVGLAVIAMLYIGFSRFGRIRLGRDDERPEFSRFAWVSMMFGAGIGVGIFFYGPSEPLAHYLSPPPHTAAAETPQALHMAMAQSHFHWGVSAWAMYALVGGAIAYSSYRRGRVTLISSVFRSLFGARQAEGTAGRIVDMFAIVATLFGTAATLGLAAVQIGQGVQIVAGLDGVSNTLLIVIIAVLTVAFVVSAVSGVSRGIRYLSTTNIVLTLGMVLFVFIAGPTLFLLNLIPSGVVEYADRFLEMSGRSLSWGAATVEFQSWWTAFYWAWWIAWTPFVGVFLARISRGRTLREFVAVVLAVPTSILVFAFTVLGGASIWMRRQGEAAFDGAASPEAQLFALFDRLPLAEITPFVVMAILAIFFVTSADSASVVMGTLSSRGDPAPRRTVTAFWGLMMMGIAVVMLLAGGEDTLAALQNLTILIALPFSIVLILMIVAFLKDLSTDPSAIRGDYADTALSNAARRGIEEYGDDFEIAVRRAPSGRGAGADFDSTAEEVTDWYRRTDEDGNPVDYDYETGTWADGWTPDDDGAPAEDAPDVDVPTAPTSDGTPPSPSPDASTAARTVERP
ncbi:BCCT family transporter [Micrococcus endophyticus]|uniref:Choline/carnitine/betaine transport n=1 Tax=Micrococcus endophyticus TaxID=455343 RepID=A0A7W9JLH6_9MICC|nr:BCCT family transporter [Micrococcus endophyticus]MBB5849908.1 choline/carnitine/betaine transport [Micrococcus endophyticus]